MEKQELELKKDFDRLKFEISKLKYRIELYHFQNDSNKPNKKNYLNELDDLNKELQDLVIKHLETERLNNYWDVEETSPLKKVISIGVDVLDLEDLHHLKKLGFKNLPFDTYYIAKEVNDDFKPDQETHLTFNSISSTFSYKGQRFNFEEKTLEYVFE